MSALTCKESHKHGLFYTKKDMITPEILKQLEKQCSDKRYARNAVTNALKYKRLTKTPCFCGETKVEAHHDDYTKPLDVIWVCKKHHVQKDKERKNQEILLKTGLDLSL